MRATISGDLWFFWWYLVKVLDPGLLFTPSILLCCLWGCNSSNHISLWSFRVYIHLEALWV